MFYVALLLLRMRIYSNLAFYAKAHELARVTPRRCYTFLAPKLEAANVSTKPVTSLPQTDFCMFFDVFSLSHLNNKWLARVAKSSLESNELPRI
jgi:hypothetical protein